MDCPAAVFAPNVVIPTVINVYCPSFVPNNVYIIIVLDVLRETLLGTVCAQQSATFAIDGLCWHCCPTPVCLKTFPVKPSLFYKHLINVFSINVYIENVKNVFKTLR